MGYVDGSLLFLVASHMENESKGKVRTILKTARKATGYPVQIRVTRTQP